MSRSFNRLFISGLKQIFSDHQINNNSTQVKNAALVFIISSLGNGCYAYGTSKIENSIIIKKYKMVRGGFTDFMVVDKQGKHYNVNNSLWYWKWDSVEGWNNIKEGDELKIKYYGWRIPFLGIFPNIYNIL